MRRATVVTRGFGLLENPLARLRVRRANRLIPAALREGKILDIGCGTYPYFLSQTAFAQKFGIDRQTPSPNAAGIRFFSLDLSVDPRLPFQDDYFTIITMLAVIEHINPDSLIELAKECYRTLAEGGRLIITTPAPWSNQLLKLMARIGLVSKEEIDEHVYQYSHALIAWYFGKANFDMEKIKFGYFEVFLNLYAFAIK